MYLSLKYCIPQWAAARDPQRVVILGSGRRAVRAWRELRTRQNRTVKVIGFVDDRPVKDMSPEIGESWLGKSDDLRHILLRNIVDELLIAVPVKSCYDLAQRAADIAGGVGIKVVVLQDVLNAHIRQSGFRRPQPFGELVICGDDYLTAQLLKRFIDVVGATLGLIVLAPVFIVVAAAIKATSRGPVLFIQERFGYKRRLFKMYKFRSMVRNAAELMAQLETQNEAQGPIFKIRRDPRITPLGRFLRASSLDELPQLWNVLIGNMSLVGPRPMSVRDVSLFNESRLMRRFTVKPGITGLWQVHGRNSLGFEKWVELDFHYIDRWSLGLDFRILLQTFGAVLKGTGA